MIKIAYALCETCPLFNEPFVPPFIPDDAIMIAVGEAPGAVEVTQGKPFVGQSGQLMKGVFGELGSDWEKVHRTNVVLCRPPGNREPTVDEIACCHPRLLQELVSSTAPTILSLGKTAHESLLGTYANVTRGFWQRWGLKWVLPTWHPAYVLRKPSEIKALVRDVKVALQGPDEVSISYLHQAPEWESISTVDELGEMIDRFDPGRPVSYDLETNQVVWYDRPSKRADSILMMSVWPRDFGSGFVISDEVIYNPDARRYFKAFFDKFFTLGHNAMFDNVFLRSVGIPNPRVDFDTILAKYVLDEEPPHGLKEIGKHYFGVKDYEQEYVQKYLKSRNDEYSKVPYNELATYAVWDVMLTDALGTEFERQLLANNMYEWPFDNILMPAQEALAKMELHGCRVDIPYLLKCQEVLQAEMDELTDQMRAMAGVPTLNPNSPVQLAAIIWDQLRLRPNRATRAFREHPRSTNVEALEHLASYNSKTHVKVREGDPFVDLLMHHRRVAKIKSSYIDNLVEFADTSWYIHPSGRAFGTEVGRLAFSDPAVQTIPRPSDRYGAMARGAFVPSVGNKIVIVDYSQAELRVFAALTGAQFLLDAFRDGRDIHAEVASVMYGPNFTKEQRVMAKMFNFAYIYGGNEYSFARDAGMPLRTAVDLVAKFNNVIPEAQAFRNMQLALMREQGYVKTRMGRRRRCMLITENNVDDIAKASVHMPVAASAHDLNLMSAIQLIDEGLPVIMEVHDSVILDVPAEDADAVADHVVDVMVSTAQKWFPEVPWKVDKEIKDRWSEPPKL